MLSKSVNESHLTETSDAYESPDDRLAKAVEAFLESSTENDTDAFIQLKQAHEASKAARENPNWRSADDIWMSYMNFNFQLCVILGLFFEHTNHQDVMEAVQMMVEMLKDSPEFEGRMLALKWRNLYGGVPTQEELARWKEP